MARLETTGDFEGLKVTATTLTVKGTGSGLEPAMQVDPVTLHQGDVFYVVYECKCVDVQHPLVKDSDTEVYRQQVGKAINASIVPREVVAEVLEATKSKIQAARDEATNAQALDLNYDPLGVGEDGERVEPEPAPAKPARATRARKAVKAPVKKPRALKAVDPS